MSDAAECEPGTPVRLSAYALELLGSGRLCPNRARIESGILRPGTVGFVVRVTTRGNVLVRREGRKTRTAYPAICLAPAIREGKP